MRNWLTSFALLSSCLVSAPQAGQGQLLLVSGQYRVTEVDSDNQRFGVALPEARPETTQNWVYIDPKTEITRRVTNSEGWHKEEKLNYYQFFAKVKPGLMVKLQGGRRWDGAISGKSLQIGFPEDSPH